MVSSRIRSWSPAVLLLASLLALGTLAAPAQATIQRSLSLRSGVAVAGAGTAVTFAGTLTNSPTGSALKLQIKAGSVWRDVRSLTTTTSSGAYRISVAVPTTLGKYYYRTHASAGGGRSSATSNTVSVTVLHKVDAVIKPSRTTVNGRQLVTFYGHVSPCLVGATVTLQRYKSGSWVTVTTAQLSSQCTFARSVLPTATTSYRLSVPGHGSYAPAYSATVKITLLGPAPTITTGSLPAGAIGTAYDQTLTKTGQAGTWSKSAGTLPGGITLTGSTGRLSGTPIAGGTFNFTVKFTETASSRTVSKALSITIVSGPAITTSSLPDATRGTAYSKTLAKTGGAGSWAATGLPSGITLDTAAGVISGTAIVAGDFSVSLTFTETSSAKVASKTLPLHVVDSPRPVITSTTVPDGVKNLAYDYTLTKTGNAGTWAITQGTLPTGITLNASTGQLSGTPTVSGDFGITVTFTENAAQTISDPQGLLLHISPAANSPVINTTSLVSGTVGSPYSAQLDGTGSGTWSIVSNPGLTGLPPGIALSTNPLTSGLLSGTPTTAGDFSFIVKYTTLTGNNTKLLTIHIAP